MGWITIYRMAHKMIPNWKFKKKPLIVMWGRLLLFVWVQQFMELLRWTCIVYWQHESPTKHFLSRTQEIADCTVWVWYITVSCLTSSLLVCHYIPSGSCKMGQNTHCKHPFGLHTWLLWSKSDFPPLSCWPWMWKNWPPNTPGINPCDSFFLVTIKKSYSKEKQH